MHCREPEEGERGGWHLPPRGKAGREAVRLSMVEHDPTLRLRNHLIQALGLMVEGRGLRVEGWGLKV